ncbi:hypothetical protein BDF19DRAFT_441302 [Syncephalis fuscata]|nr:hypothetical protein BDF19DRAFT_441302 [Syncephalis fuscata]
MTEKIVTEAVPLRQRLYVSGLVHDVKPEDIEQRFRPFEYCRGFAHATLDTTDKNWQRCVTMLNGAKWKGAKLRIDKAKDDHVKRQEHKQLRQLKRKAMVRHAADMSLVTDRNVEARPGWKRVMRVRKPDGTMLVYDPGMYKNNLEKLFGSERPLPVQQLTWFYPKQESLVNENRFSQIVAIKEIETDNEQMDIQKQFIEPLDTPLDLSNEFNEESNENSMMNLIMMLKWMLQINQLDTSSDQELDLVSIEADHHVEDEQPAHLHHITEEKNRSLNILNAMFGGSNSTISNTTAPTPSQDINTNQINNNSINNNDYQYNRFMWRDMTQFDPDNPDSLDLLIHPDVPIIAHPLMKEQEEVKVSSIQESAMPEVGDDKHFTVKGDLKSMFKSAATLSSALINTQEGNKQPFMLFGQQANELEEEEEEEGDNGFNFDFSAMIPTTHVSTKSIDRQTTDTSLPATFFFAHFDQPSLLRRSVYREQNIFVRTGTIENVTKNWENMRQNLTRDFKQRHKHAVRLHKRQQRGSRRVDTRD